MVSLILCCISYKYAKFSPLTKLHCFTDDTVSQQTDGCSCGIYTCWNARCFILSLHNQKTFTLGDLYKLNDEANVVLDEKSITSMLNERYSFKVDNSAMTSLRGKFGLFLERFYTLLTDHTKNEMLSDNADIQMKESGEDEETVGK